MLSYVLIGTVIVLLFFLGMTNVGSTLFSHSPGEQFGGKLNREQVLRLNPDADLIELKDGTVYVHGADWIEKEKLTKEAKIGTIAKGMATKVPNGAPIYQTKEKKPILIVDYKGKTKRYLLAMGE
ncbi:hypothetical protein ACFFGV_00830 [Pontibacillus salicampi]|uniref:Uncharacterized protein n=1 Tax=Pontibacillus salicampi TaxID=1449801 RepID=A0ABV6LIJ4_9BACI